MRNFYGFGQVPYIGAPYINPIKLGGLAGQTVPLTFPWLIYGASSVLPRINVLVDMRGQNVAARLQQIRSVYIDNMGSDVPIYVFFPDTQYSIVAKPNSSGWYPAYTNDLICWVIGLGFSDGNTPTTLVLISNLIIQPAVDVEIDTNIPLWKASPTISRGNTIYNSNYGVPALGDQFFQGQLGIGSGNTLTLFSGARPSGFFYLTNFYLNAISCNNGTSGKITANPTLESTGIAGALLSFPFVVPNDAQVNPTGGVQNIASLEGMQIKLDATQTYRMRQAGPSFFGGQIIVQGTFTYNPL